MQVRKQRRQEVLRRDRLAWVMLAFGLVFYAALGTVILVFAMGGGK